MFSCFDEPFRSLDGQLRNAGVTLDVASFELAISSAVGCERRKSVTSSGRSSTSRMIRMHLRMIFCHCLGDVMQQRCLAGARRRDNQTALPHSERRHQIHDSRRITIRHCLELDPFVRINRRQLLKWREALIFRRLFTIDLQQLDQLRAATAAPGFTVNPHPITQGKTANDFGRDENVLRRLHEVALRVTQEPETLAGDFNDAFAEFRFSLNLFATFGSSLPSLASA